MKMWSLVSCHVSLRAMGVRISAHGVTELERETNGLRRTELSDPMIDTSILTCSHVSTINLVSSTRPADKSTLKRQFNRPKV